MLKMKIFEHAIKSGFHKLENTFSFSPSWFLSPSLFSLFSHLCFCRHLILSESCILFRVRGPSSLSRVKSNFIQILVIHFFSFGGYIIRGHIIIIIIILYQCYYYIFILLYYIVYLYYYTILYIYIIIVRLYLYYILYLC